MSFEFVQPPQQPRPSLSKDAQATTMGKSRLSHFKIKLSKPARKRLIKKLVVFGIVLAIILWLRPFGLFSKPATLPSNNQTPTQPASGLKKGNPDFQALLPKGKTAEQLGGWARVSPPNSEAVFAFTDSIGSVNVIVSQQTLPQALSNNTSKELEKIASAYGPAEKIITPGSTEIYLSRSKSGPASIALKKNNLLILIKANNTVTDKAISDYVDSLR